MFYNIVLAFRWGDGGGENLQIQADPIGGLVGWFLDPEVDEYGRAYSTRHVLKN